MRATLVKIIRAIDLIGFAFANFIVWQFSKHFFEFASSLWSLLYFSLSLLASLAIIKTEFIFLFVDTLPKLKRGRHILASLKKLSKLNKKFRGSFSSHRHLISFLVKIVPPVIFKQIFFNTLYYLFPVLLVWVVFSGVFKFVGVLTLADRSGDFFQIVATISILLGIFQYFIKRHEEKIQVKITQVTTLISRIVDEETSFEKFFNSLELYGAEQDLINFAKKITDPKLYADDIISLILNHPEMMRIFERILNRSTAPISNFNYISRFKSKI